MKADATINRYAAGYSLDVDKDKELSAEEAFVKEFALQKTIVNMPNDTFLELIDNLHFLSSKRHSIDAGNGGWFGNMGNILFKGTDKKFSIIDVQPFLYEHPGINMAHTKGFNTPLFLTRGLIIGSRKYAAEHSKDPLLIDMRTDTIDKVISASQAGHLNDMGGYLTGDMDKIAYIWERQLSILNIDEKYRKNFIQRLCAIKDENPYSVVPKHIKVIRVSGRNGYS